MPGRKYNTNAYRYGLNGQEKDDEISGVEGAHTSAEFWEYDSRLGRRWNVDPIAYEFQSYYACFNNNPICFADPSGLEGEKKKDPNNKHDDDGDGISKADEGCTGDSECLDNVIAVETINETPGGNNNGNKDGSSDVKVAMIKVWNNPDVKKVRNVLDKTKLYLGGTAGNLNQENDPLIWQLNGKRDAVFYSTQWKQTPDSPFKIDEPNNQALAIYNRWGLYYAKQKKRPVGAIKFEATSLLAFGRMKDYRLLQLGSSAFTLSVGAFGGIAVADVLDVSVDPHRHILHGGYWPVAAGGTAIVTLSYTAVEGMGVYIQGSLTGLHGWAMSTNVGKINFGNLTTASVTFGVVLGGGGNNND